MRTKPVVVALLALVAAVGAVPAAGTAASHAGTGAGALPASNVAQDGGNETGGNGSVPPGAQLAGVVGVQQAEIEGTVEERSFGLSVARAASNESRAAVVASQVGETRERVEDLEARRNALRERLENGTITRGRYQAELAELNARARTAGRLADRTANVSRGLPADLLSARGIDAAAIRTLGERAANLTGPEVAEIARSIAGGNVGQPVVPGQARGGPGEAGNRTGAPDDAGDRTGGTGAAGNATDAGTDADADVEDGDAPMDTPEETGNAPNGTEGSGPDGRQTGSDGG